jgi:hypothetical protein
MSSRLGHIWFSGAIARLMQLSQPRGAEIRRRPCIVCAGDGYKVRHYKGEVLIALILVLDIMPLAIIYAVVYAYSKWLKVRCLINWPRLSGCIQRTYSSGSVYIFRGRAVVQFFRISALFAVYIGSLVLSTSSTISWRYLSIGYTIYLYSIT